MEDMATSWNAIVAVGQVSGELLEMNASARRSRLCPTAKRYLATIEEALSDFGYPQSV